MTDNERVRAWMAKASHDFKAVQRLCTGVDAPLDVAIYHCQQAAEKIVKGYLCHVGAPIEKTHDVERLIKLATVHEPAFANWLDEAEIITPYATRFRYPLDGVPMEPSRVEFDETLEATQRLYVFVLSMLPPETHPTSSLTP